MRPDSRPDDAERSVILIAIRNGGDHLAEQLESFSAQSASAWDLIASDDGSEDDSPAILEHFARRWSAGATPHQVTRLDGPRQGFVRNFFHLLRHVPPGTACAALSDQDDVWFPDKLARAQAALARLPAGQPALYCARSRICDATLRPLRDSTRFTRPPHFRNALVQSIGGGNTMVLNRAAIDLVRVAVDEAQEAAAHDWWLYQLITACGGTILRDDSPVLHYRQHGTNTIGANTSIRGRIYRILFIMGRRFSAWNTLNLRALAASAHRFTPEAQATLSAYAAARQGGLVTRLRALHRAKVYRQSRTGTLALYVAALVNRL